MISTLKPAQGKLLVSEPFMLDPNFKRSVVLLAKHNEEGSVGFVLNQITDLKLGELVEELSGFDAPLYLVGPVESDTLHFIHRLGDSIEGSEEIAPGIFWGGNFEALKIMINTGQISLDEVKFFIGYSGWNAGQLELEMEENSWIVSNAENAEVFSAPDVKLWAQTIKGMGKRYAHLAGFPENPNLN